MKGSKCGWLFGGEYPQAWQGLFCLLLILSQTLATFPSGVSADIFQPAPVDSPLDDISLGDLLLLDDVDVRGAAVDYAYTGSARRSQVVVANGPTWQHAADSSLPASIFISPSASTVLHFYLSRAPPVSLSSC